MRIFEEIERILMAHNIYVYYAIIYFLTLSLVKLPIEY